MTLIRIATFTADNRSATLAKLLRAHGLENFEPRRAETGKPYLLAADGSLAGLAISHVRGPGTSCSFMAVSDVATLGIDAAVWPQPGADEIFLASIAAPEDAALIAKCRAAGRDPATLLWVLKEAALKAHGEVMTDPRHITVGLSTNGQIHALLNSAARAPLPRSKLRVLEWHRNNIEPDIILSVAIADMESRKNGTNLDVLCDNASAGFEDCDWI